MGESSEAKVVRWVVVGWVVVRSIILKRVVMQGCEAGCGTR